MQQLSNWLANPTNMIIVGGTVLGLFLLLVIISFRQKRRLEAERKAWEEQRQKEQAELRAREEAERQARIEAERRADEERKAREEAERRAREEAERHAREEAERKAREEAERKAREEAERQAREEAERKAREEAERKAREEAERKAKQEAERKAKQEAERKAKALEAQKAKQAADKAQKAPPPPAPPKPPVAKPKPAAAAAAVAPAGVVGAGRKVLVVEDSATMRQAIDWVLTPEEFVLTVVKSGAEALAKAKEVKPDVVIADLTLDDKDGYEICRELRQDGDLANVPVILLHGPTVELDQGKVKEVDATATMSKPFDSQELINKVHEVAS